MSTILEMPPIGLGTWGMGGRFEADRSNFNSSVKAITDALEIGYRLIDTAEIYGEGVTEEIVGEAIKDFPRPEVYLVSKVWKTNLAPEAIRRSLDGSLRRLKTSYLDLYLVHWPNPEFPLDRTLETLKTLKAEGLIKNIGVSNFDEPLLKEAQSILGSEPLCANQIELSLAAPEAAKNLLPFCQQNNIRVQAYRPLNRGVLATGASKLVEEMAVKYQKTPAQIALNWVVSLKAVPLVKASQKIHLQENFDSLSWSLQPADVNALTASVLTK